MSQIKRYSLDEAQQIRILGRTNGTRDPLTLFWSMSGIEMNICCSELWVDFHADYTILESWAVVLVDGALMQRFIVPRGDSRIPILNGLETTRFHNVKILRDTQPVREDPFNLLQITGLETDGSFAPLPEPELRIGFIGDSITTGEGNIGVGDDAEWITMYMHGVDTYAYLTAAALGAEERVFSVSGWGVYCGWDNNTYHRIPEYYDRLCGMVGTDEYGQPLEGEARERYQALGAYEKWDFSAWQPDALVINLGTNDNCAFTQPPLTDPRTGRIMKVHARHRSDGSEYIAETTNGVPLKDVIFNEEDVLLYENACVDFLAQLRKDYPEAELLWVYGMLGGELGPACNEAVSRYCRMTGDRKAHYLELPDTKPGEYGSRMHPGRISHEHAAKVLTARLRELLDL